MKYRLIIIILFLIACNKPDPYKYAIFKFDPNRDKDLFPGNVTPSELSNNDILEIESIVAKQVDFYNKKEKKEEKLYKEKYPKEHVYDNLIHNAFNYRKQLIAIINAHGEKEVWVNCLCNENIAPKDKIEQVGDGGSCFFQAKINLTKNLLYDFKVNAVE